MDRDRIFEINKINGYFYSKMVQKEFSKKIITTELQFMNDINKVGKISKENFAIKFKMPRQLVDNIFDSLSENKLIKTNSPEWELTRKGEKILEYCMKISDQVENEISNDSSLRELSKIS